MERDNPLNDLNEEQLFALFKGIDAPVPPPDFVASTMRAVRRAPLPPGRKSLRDPLTSMLGWAAVIGAVAFAVFTIALSQPIVLAGFSRLITRGVGTGVWFLQFGQTGLRLLDVLTTTGVAVSRAAATAEGAFGLTLAAVVGALSLSALYRMLIAEGENSQWQEVS